VMEGSAQSSLQVCGSNVADLGGPPSLSGYCPVYRC
jgi:hypothetical protein